MSILDRRLLFISRNFPPLIGGMERLNYRAYLAFSNTYSIAACLPAGAKKLLVNRAECEQVEISSLFRYLMACQWKSVSLARRFKPDFVYSGSGLTAPAALMAAKLTGAKSICFLHGLDIVVDHPVYQKLFLPAIRRIDKILVNSHHTASLAARLGISEKQINIVHPGCDLPEWEQRSSARLRYRAALGLTNYQPVLLAAGRLTARKGLAEFIRYSMPAIHKAHTDLVLLIIGSEPGNALRHKHGVLDNIKAAIAATNLASSIRVLGPVDDSELSEAYFSADAMIFPVLDLPGDVEGFGMVAIEAAAHGLPTIGFHVGGVPDAVAQGDSGWLVRSGEYEALSDRVNQAMGNSKAFSPLRCREQAERFGWQVFERKILSALDD